MKTQSDFGLVDEAESIRSGERREGIIPKLNRRNVEHHNVQFAH